LLLFLLVINQAAEGVGCSEGNDGHLGRGSAPPLDLLLHWRLDPHLHYFRRLWSLFLFSCKITVFSYITTTYSF